MNKPKTCHRKLTVPLSSIVGPNGGAVDPRACEGRSCMMWIDFTDPVRGIVGGNCGEAILVNIAQNQAVALSNLDASVQAMGLASGALKVVEKKEAQS
jgi:hypothetical protein